MSYKLTYFNARGLGEPIRQLFHLGGVKFEDERIELESFGELKKKTPFGQLPVLTVSGLEIPQSAAICRYLARKFGYAGKTAEQEVWVDAIGDQFKDFYIGAVRPLITAKLQKKPVEEVEKLTKEVFLPARDKYLLIFERLMKKSKSGFLVGDGLTWIDLVVVENLVTLENLGLFSAEENPKLAALKKKVHATPKLKDYLANRPFSEI